MKSRLWSFGIKMLCFIIAGTPLFASTYYISTDGKDSNTGSIESPWASFRHALRNTAPGDTILVRGGTYLTNEVWIRKNRGGADGRYLTIKNFKYI